MAKPPLIASDMGDDDWGFEEELPAEIPKLSDQILGKCADSRFDEEVKKFLPAGCIEDLVSPEAIIKEVLDKGHLRPEDLILPTGKQKLVDFVLEKAKIVFAITVISGLHGPQLGKATLEFMKINFTDSCLPLTEEHLAEIPFFRDEAAPWSKTRIYNFCREQWKFLAPVFSQRNFKVDVRPEHILPFIMKSEVVKQGAFGQVFMVKVHPNHQEDSILNQSDGSPAKLAIKEFMNPTNEDEQLQQDAEAVWNSEVSTLDEISGLRHENLIQRIAAITRGKKRYLMFLWAEGGNLWDFWENNPKPKVTAALVKDIIQQIRGMADALNKLHNYKGQRHFRHGDIKPENILNFPNADKSRIGTFKISDMGSAKSHAAATRLRERTAGNKFATMVYQAPEAITQKAGSTSRLYDIWSIGCVTLEFMVWLLYGYNELQEFKKRIKGPYGEASSFFITTEIEEARQEGIVTKRVAQIHPAVQACLNDISNDEECAGDTALGDLLEIIKTKLLVIALPERSPSTNDHEPGENFSVTNADETPPRRQPFGNQRATAGGFLDALDRILLSSDDSRESYWFTGRSRDNIHLSRIPKIVADDDPSSSLYVGWKPHSDQSPIAHRLKHPSPQDDSESFMAVPDHNQNLDRVNLSNDWSYPVDNAFANRLLENTDILIKPVNDLGSNQLCGKCESMNFWASNFRIEDTWLELEKNMSKCNFCRMRWNTSKNLNRKDYALISFERKDSVLRMNDETLPVMSIFRSQDLKVQIPIQIGFPQLPEAGSKSHFKILRQWLKNCDNNHQKFKCQPKSAFVPTRLIDLGQDKSETVRLYETKKTDSLKYIALSHPWGKEPPYFCTFRKDVEEYKKGIKISDLTLTFKHAVETARELGLQYLWIDSICIIQGPDGDFEQEAEHMESVFSSAYCVIAASSAKRQIDGFLNERDGREFVTFNHGRQDPFYVCRFIDDFNEHVLDGALCKRGWVMQERVLAHRTIYFTNKQTYWECGDGVRCETLTKLDNKLASFLGDPNFPNKITSKFTSKGERIIFYQDLYKQYSRLAFTRWEDRPIAIAGLEKRLIHDLKTQGGFGVFDDGQSLLCRSLLWQRDIEETSLRKITFPAERNINVPTWSWMAYEGAINFLDLPLGGVKWQEGELHSPWIPDASKVYHTTDSRGSIELTGIAREFDIQNAGEGEAILFHDMPERAKQPSKCIVMGRKREPGTGESSRHYVLLIAEKGAGTRVYERVGVGFMPGRFINLAAPGPSSLVKVR